MKKVVLLGFALCLYFISNGQTQPFDELNANSGSNKKIEWISSGYGNGYGHKIYNLDPGFGGKTLLNFAGRNNSTSWTDILTLTSNGKVGIGTTDPTEKLNITGNLRIDGNYGFKLNSTSTTDPYNSISFSQLDEVKWIMDYGTAQTQNLRFIKFNGGSGTTFLNFDYNNNQIEATNVDFGIGTSNPEAKFHVHEDQFLGSSSSDNILLTRISGRTSNTVMSNVWLRRDASGSDWFTARLHDGISVDGSYLNPGSDTRTWWERDPYNNTQSWGTANQTYMTLNAGKLAIGTTDFSGNHKLRVEGSIGAREIKVEASGWSDFVFERDYELRTLEEVEEHINENGHLPEIPSEAEVTENGINLGEMNAKLLQKIEELTLYLIEQNKEIKELKEKVNSLENK
ncbi:hypothetical protein [Ekhidna sp.]